MRESESGKRIKELERNGYEVTVVRTEFGDLVLKRKKRRIPCTIL